MGSPRWPAAPDRVGACRTRVGPGAGGMAHRQAAHRAHSDQRGHSDLWLENCEPDISPRPGGPAPGNGHRHSVAQPIRDGALIRMIVHPASRQNDPWPDVPAARRTGGQRYRRPDVPVARRAGGQKHMAVPPRMQVPNTARQPTNQTLDAMRITTSRARRSRRPGRFPAERRDVTPMSRADPLGRAMRPANGCGRKRRLSRSGRLQTPRHRPMWGRQGSGKVRPAHGIR